MLGAMSQSSQSSLPTPSPSISRALAARPLLRAAVRALPAVLLACAAGEAVAGDPAGKPAANKPAASKPAPGAPRPPVKPEVMPIPAPDPPQTIDPAALAALSRPLEVSAEALRAALVTGKPEGVVFSTALDLGGGAGAVAWSECSKTGCRGQVATFTGGAQPKLVKKAALVAPARVHFVDGFTFQAPSFADLDGDGAAELVLHYTVVEPPRKALGSMTREYLTAYDPHKLGVVFSHELRRAGGDSEEACHWMLEQGGDKLFATGYCNVRACAEAASLPALCKPTKKLVETWRKARGQVKYSKVAR
jgi:hypothetical protein